MDAKSGQLYPSVDDSTIASRRVTPSSDTEEERIENIRAELKKKCGWDEEDERRLNEDGHIYMIPSMDSTLAENIRRETEEKLRRAASSDEIRSKRMGRIRAMGNALARVMDPYTEHVPTVDDFVANGQKLVDALSIYPDEYNSWAKLIQRGLSLKHFVRGVWWDVTTLVECYNVNWRMMHTDIKLTAAHLIEQKATSSELVQLRIDVPALVVMGMDSYWFKFATYELIMEWKKLLGLTKQHLISDLNMFASDFAWLISYRGWKTADMMQGLHMSLGDINRKDPHSPPPPEPRYHAQQWNHVQSHRQFQPQQWQQQQQQHTSGVLACDLALL